MSLAENLHKTVLAELDQMRVTTLTCIHGEDLDTIARSITAAVLSELADHEEVGHGLITTV